MSLLRPALLALTLALPLGAAVPAAALGIPFDLPRLDFPTDGGATTTRGCTTAPAPCGSIRR